MGPPATTMESAEAIAELLAAEREASVIIEEANAAREARMMLAKTEAEAEIAAFRGHLDAQHQAFLAQSGGSEEAKAAKDATDSQIAALRKTAAGEKAKVTKILVDFIVSPQCTKRRLLTARELQHTSVPGRTRRNKLAPVTFVGAWVTLGSDERCLASLMAPVVTVRLLRFVL